MPQFCYNNRNIQKCTLKTLLPSFQKKNFLFIQKPKASNTTEPPSSILSLYNKKKLNKTIDLPNPAFPQYLSQHTGVLESLYT